MKWDIYSWHRPLPLLKHSYDRLYQCIADEESCMLIFVMVLMVIIFFFPSTAVLHLSEPCSQCSSPACFPSTPAAASQCSEQLLLCSHCFSTLHPHLCFPRISPPVFVTCCDFQFLRSCHVSLVPPCTLTKLHPHMYSCPQPRAFGFPFSARRWTWNLRVTLKFLPPKQRKGKKKQSTVSEWFPEKEWRCKIWLPP